MQERQAVTASMIHLPELPSRAAPLQFRNNFYFHQYVTGKRFNRYG